MNEFVRLFFVVVSTKSQPDVHVNSLRIRTKLCALGIEYCVGLRLLSMHSSVSVDVSVDVYWASIFRNVFHFKHRSSGNKIYLC